MMSRSSSCSEQRRLLLPDNGLRFFVTLLVTWCQVSRLPKVRQHCLTAETCGPDVRTALAQAF